MRSDGKERGTAQGRKCKFGVQFSLAICYSRLFVPSNDFIVDGSWALGREARGTEQVQIRLFGVRLPLVMCQHPFTIANCAASIYQLE